MSDFFAGITDAFKSLGSGSVSDFFDIGSSLLDSKVLSQSEEEEFFDSGGFAENSSKGFFSKLSDAYSASSQLHNSKNAADISSNLDKLYNATNLKTTTEGRSGISGSTKPTKSTNPADFERQWLDRMREFARIQETIGK